MTTQAIPRSRPRLRRRGVIGGNANNNAPPSPLRLLLSAAAACTALLAGPASASVSHRVTTAISQVRSSPSDSNSIPAFDPREQMEEEEAKAGGRRLDGEYAADDAYVNEGAGDDGYLDIADLEFGEVSIMPVSCVNYHNGHMIKFQFFEKSSSLNCHFKNLGTFVVSISHYMRAYFNYQALAYGDDFELPGDVGFLNCVMLKETQDDDQPLYAKIGCQHRDTYTSTKLQLLLYNDAQCSNAYYDEEENRADGYDINGYFLSNKVSFRPPFYSCQGCAPEEISESFTKQYSAWYDDDYISGNGEKQNYDDDDAGGGGGDDDDGNAAAADDAASYYQPTDDGTYYQPNDDAYNYAAAYDDAAGDGNNDDAADYYAYADDAAGDDAAGDDDGSNHYVNTDDAVYYSYKAHDDDFYGMDDDGNRRLRRRTRALYKDASYSLSAMEAREEYAQDFHREMALIHRHLEDQAGDGDGDDDDVAAWNMCQRVHKYGMWCDGDCQALDTFRVDEWSRSDVFLLVIMCVFMGAMMLLVFAKRVKAYERAAMWGDEPGAPSPGLPPCAMLMLFAIVFTIIVVLAALKFVNETLVFAVVTCILLFIYMLKLTLFESRKQVFLPARSGRTHSLKDPFY